MASKYDRFPTQGPSARRRATDAQFEEFMRLMQTPNTSNPFASTYEAPPEEPGFIEEWLPTIVRGGGAVIGSTPMVGGLGMGGAEILAQLLEGRFSPLEIAGAGAVGAAGGGLAATLLKNLSKPGMAAIKAAPWAAAAPVAKSLIEEQELPGIGEVAASTALGTGSAYGLAKLLGKLGPKAVDPNTKTWNVDTTGSTDKGSAVLRGGTIQEGPGGILGEETPMITRGGKAEPTRGPLPITSKGPAPGRQQPMGQGNLFGPRVAPAVENEADVLAKYLSTSDDPNKLAMGMDPYAPAPASKAVNPYQDIIDTEKAHAQAATMRASEEQAAAKAQAAWNKEQAKLAEQAAMADAIEQQKFGLVANAPRISESISAPLPGGGTQRSTTTFRAPDDDEATDVLESLVGRLSDDAPQPSRARMTLDAPTPAPSPVEAQFANNPFAGLGKLLTGAGPEVVAPAETKVATSLQEALTPKPPTAAWLAKEQALDKDPMLAIEQALFDAKGEGNILSSTDFGMSGGMDSVTNELQAEVDRLNALRGNIITRQRATPLPETAPPTGAPGGVEVSPNAQAAIREGMAMLAAREAQQTPKLNLPEILEGESIGDYLRRSGVDNINTTPDEAAANQMAAAGGSPLATFFGKTPKVDAAGEAYRQAKVARSSAVTPEEAVNPLAVQQLGASLATEAERAGLPTRRPNNAASLRGVGKEISAQLGTKPAAAAPAPTPEGQLSMEEMQRRVQGAKGRPGGALWNFLGGERGAGGRGGERGIIAPELASRLGLAAGGAVLGGASAAATDNDPILGAVAGGAAGAGIPSIIKGIGSIAPRLAADPQIPNDIKGTLQAMGTPEGFSSVAQRIYHLLPQVLRANLLTSPNIFSNAIAAPYGAAWMKGLELHLSGDSRGMEILSRLGPDNFAREFQQSFGEAQQLVGEFERAGGHLTGEAYTPTEKILSLPGTFITTGDVTTRRILVQAGLSDAEARAATLTSDPEWQLSKKVLDFQRGAGPAGQMLMPFARTLLNVVEQGAQRTPVLGSVVQAARETPDAANVQLIQQMLGGATGVAGGAAGYYTPEILDSVGLENNPTAKKVLAGFVRNVPGPYALLGSLGYAGGLAAGAGDAPIDVARKTAVAGVNELPLPATDIVSGQLSALFKLLNPKEKQLEVLMGAPGVMPGVVKAAIEEANPPNRPIRRPKRAKRPERD